MLRNERLVAVALVCGGALACAPSRGIDNNSTSCTPGSTITCSCGDSGQGEATCNAGGTLYGDCVCGAAPSCDGGSEATCTCSDGGSGVAACLSDGGVGSCVCEGMGGVCTPNTIAACTCGDGGPGEQLCNSTGTAYGSCVCQGPTACTVSSLTASGSLTTSSGGINYSGTPVVGTFAGDLGASCLGTASVSFVLATNSCALELQFGAVVDGSGGLTSAVLNVDSGCSTLTGLAAGTYSSPAGYGLTSLQVTPPIPGATQAAVCLTDETLQFGADAITLLSSNGATVTVHLGQLTVNGALYITNSASATCYSTASCGTGYSANSQKWCTPVAGCGTGLHDGGNGTCVPDGTCSSGYHSDGTGNCVPLGDCASGYHDDGTGNCVLVGQCATGYHDGGNGTCVMTGTCTAGYHDGGDGSCVPLGDCVTGDHDGGNGSCLPAGLCATGYMLTSTGTCVASTTCGTGDHNGGNGTCVPDGTCSSGYQNGGNGTCVPDGTCSSGYQNGGNGTCVLAGTCSSGYHNGGSGTCVLAGTCSSGYIIGTGGNCVAESACMITGSPVANAGPDQSVSVGVTVTLSGAASTGDVNPVANYTWTFQSIPSGSAAVLTGNGITADFVPDLAGSYVVQLVVADTAGCTSTAAFTTVTATGCVAGLGWGWPTAPAGTPPTARDGHTAVYDSVNQQMVVFGGQTSTTTVMNDTWVMSLPGGGTPTWTELTPGGTPPAARYGHTAIYDSTLEEMIVFGGASATNVAYSDVWALSLPANGTPTWIELSPAAGPAARFEHTAVFDSGNSRMVIYAGYNGSAALADAWALSLPATGTPAWTELAPTGTAPAARMGQTAIYDPHFKEMVIFGGLDGVSTWFNDAWTLSLPATGTPAWAELAPSGTAPTGLANASAVYDSDAKEMLVLGGFDSTEADDSGLYSLSLPFTGTPAWTTLSPSGAAPSPRDSHSAIFDANLNATFVFGGEDYNVTTGAFTFYQDSYDLSKIVCP